jgi:hypothetical protein
MYMAKGNVGDIMKGIFYLILILIVLVLITKFWGLREFFKDIGLFLRAIFKPVS